MTNFGKLSELLSEYCRAETTIVVVAEAYGNVLGVVWAILGTNLHGQGQTPTRCLGFDKKENDSHL